MISDRPQVVPEEAPVRVTITSAMRHLCPHVDEVDNGTVTLAWTCAGQTLELHSLAAYLQSFAGERISHEELTRQLQADLATLHGIADVAVTSAWATAGMAVDVVAGLR